MTNALTFFNWTDRDFTCPWNGEEFTIPAGESMMLESGWAMTFAKHLAIREMNDHKPQPIEHNALKTRDEFIKKALVAPEPKEISEARLNAEQLNQEESEEPGEKVFLCEVCGKEFKTERGFQLHMTRMHPAPKMEKDLETGEMKLKDDDFEDAE